MESLISVRSLHKTYRSKPWQTGFHALRGIDLEIGPGTVFGLLGPNGAGKTTLIKVLMGLVGRWKGEARLCGYSAGDARARRRIGYLPEAHRLPGYLTGRQVLRLYSMYSGRDRKWTEDRIDEWVAKVDMSHAVDRKVREYSKGMQQRIGLAQAMLHEPELIFLDEPTDGVDPVGRAAIRKIVEDLKNAGVSVFINSHLLMEVEQICDRVVIMNKGQIIREGTVEELTPSTGLVEFTLASVPDNLAELLGHPGGGFQPTEDGFQVSCEVAEQNDLIDRLRRNGIDIKSISPRKLTLEQSFIDLVSEEN